MKKWFISLLTLLFAVSGSAFSQDRDFAKQLTDTMKVRLTLNDDQYQKVYKINEDFMSKMAALRADNSGKMAKFNKMKTIDKDRDNALKPVLSDDQFKAFQEFKKRNRTEMKSRMKSKQ